MHKRSSATVPEFRDAKDAISEVASDAFRASLSGFPEAEGAKGISLYLKTNKKDTYSSPRASCRPHSHANRSFILVKFKFADVTKELEAPR